MANPADHESSVGGYAVGDGLHPPVGEEDRVLASDLGTRGQGLRETTKNEKHHPKTILKLK